MTDRSAENRPLVVVSLDGLASSFLGPYGNTWFPTPGFDALAADAMLFERVFAPSIDPTETLARCWQVVPGAVAATDSLARRLIGRGVNCRLVTDEPSIGELGRRSGFDTILLKDDASSGQARAADLDSTDALRKIGGVLRTLERRGADGLTWVHLSGPARIWDAPLDLQQELRDDDDPEPGEWLAPPVDLDPTKLDPAAAEDARFRLQLAYAAQVRVWDAAIEFLRDGLEALAADDAESADGPSGAVRLVVVGTRGFATGLHGPCGDFDRAGDETLQVPVLIATAPDDAGLRVDRLGSLEELSALLESEAFSARLGPEPPSTERLDPWSACRRDLRPTGPDRLFWSTSNGASIRTVHWLLTLDRSGTASLFVKPDDRFEMNDVAGRLPHEVELLSAALRAWEVDRSPGSLAFTSPLPPPPGAA
ncbi:MAG TPA: hypothetical protein DCQ98_12220 [Planctomycetaceae bacterium]|nr:hypothetical protein [Planctomycetaceae bacterium]HRE99743.1 hypothetical protein [Pirellulaceae bacterium]